MKQTVLLVLLCLLFFKNYGQVIVGKVVDELGNPLVGANVVIEEYLSGATTGSDGKFSINTKKGKSTVVVSFLGYENWKKTIIVYSDYEDIGNISLVSKAYMSEEIIVKALRADDYSPVAYSSIGGEELQKRNVAQDLPYLLELSPSLVTTSESGLGIGATAFRIRGTDPTRINITINGIPLNDSESQAVFWANMPDFASSVKSLQITRGVGTSTNGSASFGASLNMFTTSLSNKPYAEVSFVGGSFNTFKQNIVAGTGVLSNGFSFDLKLSNMKSDGYVENAFSDHQSIMLSGAWRNEKSFVRANIIYGKQKTGITWEGCPKDSVDTNPRYNPAGEYFDNNGERHYYKDQSDNYIQTHYQLLYSTVLIKNLDLSIGLHYTRGDGYYEEYKQNRKLFNYDLPYVIIPNSLDTIKVTDLIQRKMMANDFYGTTMSLNYVKSKFVLSIGASINRHDGDHFGRIIWMKYSGNNEKDKEWYRNNGLKTDMNLFTKLNYELLPKIHVYGDIQYRHIKYIMKGDDSDLVNLNQKHMFDFFNPKIGVYYSVNNNMKTYISFATSNREPTRTNFKDAKGDPNKKPLAETLFDYELGYTYQSPKFSANANFYYMKYNNQLVPTGEKSNVGYDIMTNISDSYRTGIELMAGIKPISKLSIDANVTFSKNKIRKFISWASFYDEDWNETYKSYDLGETDIAYSPNIISACIISYKVFSGFDFSLISKYVGKQFFDNTSNKDRMLNPYWVNNIQINYSFNTKLIEEIQLKLLINNIFNIKYSSNAYGGAYFEQDLEKTWSYYFPQAGINFMAGVILKF